MKRHVAATLLGVIGWGVMDSHIDWVAQDHGTLLEISGQKVDARGWISEHWRQWRQDCRWVQRPPTDTATAIAVLLSLELAATLLLLGAQVIAEFERLPLQKSKGPL